MHDLLLQLQNLAWALPTYLRIQMCNLKLYSVNDGRDTPDEEEYEEEEEEEGDNEVRTLSLSR